MTSVLRTAVSRKKRRYQKNGYDLDLACTCCVKSGLKSVTFSFIDITDRIIAMGFPSEGIEGAYRCVLVRLEFMYE